MLTTTPTLRRILVKLGSKVANSCIVGINLIFGFVPNAWNYEVHWRSLFKHPLLLVALSGVSGYLMFILQTQVERENQLHLAQLTALNDVTALYGQMLSNIDCLGKARCELLMGRLNSTAAKNQRSSEMQERLSKTSEHAGALTFRVAALFGANPPWYKRIYLRLTKPFREPHIQKNMPDDLLSHFQDFHHFYLDYQDQAMFRVLKIPQGVSCEADDNSYLDNFNQRIPFKFVRIYNDMAPNLGIAKLGIDLKPKKPRDRHQVFSLLTPDGRSVKMDCLVNSNDLGTCSPQR